VSVIDGHPATLAWLGSVRGQLVVALGVQHLGQTCSVSDLYRHFEIDAEAIAASARSFIGPRRG
jgi:pyruvate dehydrogenase E1 component